MKGSFFMVAASPAMRGIACSRCIAQSAGEHVFLRKSPVRYSSSRAFDVDNMGGYAKKSMLLFLSFLIYNLMIICNK